jgi:hypothetical protein
MNKLPEEIGKLTLYQFYSLISGLGKKVNWDAHVVAMPVSGKYDETKHPLYEFKNGHRNNHRSFSDFMQMVNTGKT